jgi:hypothetical protein
MTTVYLNHKWTGVLYKIETPLRSTLFVEWMEVNKLETLEVTNCESKQKEEVKVWDLCDHSVWRNLHMYKR